MKLSLKLTSYLLLAFMVARCSTGKPDQAHNVKLARVGSTYLTLDEARHNVPDFLLAQDSIGTLKRYRKNWIQRQLILQEAQHVQLVHKQEVQEQLRRAREEVLLNALKQSVVTKFKKKTKISDQEARSYFEKNKEQLILNERYVKFRHIETPDIKKVRAAREALRKDEPWPQVAMKYSIHAEKNIQLSKNFWPQSSVLNDVELMHNYVATLDSSEFSPIQRIHGIYHFVQITGVRAKGDYSDPDWFMDQLKQWLLAEKERKHYDSYLKNLYFKAKSDNEIEVYNVTSSSSNANSDSDSLETP